MCEHVTYYEAGFAEYALYGESCRLSAARRREPGAGRHAGAGDHRRCTRSTRATSSRARPSPSAEAAPSACWCSRSPCGPALPACWCRTPCPRSARWRRSSAPIGPSTRCNEDLVAAGRELTEGRGFDTVFECSGKLAVAKQCVGLADKCGTVVWVGVYHEDADLPHQPLLPVRQRADRPLDHPGAVHVPAGAQAPVQVGPGAA